MEESKYYTPELEEFYCLGFEYQSKEGFQDGTVKTKEQFDSAKWVDDVVDNEYDFPYINRALNGKNAENGLCGIRAKFLDREDMESLGWDHDQTTKDGAYFYFGTLMDQNQYLLVCENARQSKGGDYTNLSICNVNDGMNGGNGHCFDGVVKNKSELRKLMKMLQINL